MSKSIEMTILNFGMDQLCDYRMHVAEILNSDTVDHTPATLALMRSAYSPNDPELAQIDFIEEKIRSTRRHRPRLHAEILASVLSIVRLSRPSSVLDVGCGEGLLVRALAQARSVLGR